MNGIKRKIAAATAALLVLAASLELVSYARWVRGIADGNRELANENYSAAEQAYSAAERWFDHTSVPSAFLRTGYRRLVFNQARLFDATKKYDDLAHLLEGAAAHHPELAAEAEYHFWMGIVEYRKAVAETDKQALRAGLQRASDSFRMALASGPDAADWDAKYNYEFVFRLLAGMRNKNDDTPEKLNRGGMKILREDPDHPKEQQQKLAPDKRG
jgi:DNA-directed RNA polymerase specialized sigma24 family protein